MDGQTATTTARCTVIGQAGRELYHSVARLGAAAATALAACETALRTVVAGVLALDRADRRGRGCSG